MDELLKSLYIKLDSTAQSLTKDAIGQMLIKIIYSIQDTRATKTEILRQYNTVVKNGVSRDIIEQTLSLLVRNNEIKYLRGEYYLSTTKKDKISKSLTESQERLKYVIDTYFRPFSSSEEAITDWFKDVMLFFFENYSKIWVADLCYHKDNVIRRKDDIISAIEKRIHNHKDIEKSDYKRISIAFTKLLTQNDSKVDELFWEYGTSQFAAQLIKNSSAADKITIETFSNSVCVLDTNVLMYLGLESSEYYMYLSSLEKAFEKLKMSVGILYITKQEYENTIAAKRDYILRLVENYKLDVIEETRDDYVQTAKKRGCKNIDDFKRFFTHISKVPKFVDKSLRINLIGETKEIATAIETAKKDGTKTEKLNQIYKQITQHDKRQNALLHDVGIIAGVKELRKEGKYFILSQESSVNGYAKLTPSDNELPMAINIETLINVLALNSYDVDCENYIPLFASIIRMNLQPNRETFKLEDLAYILEKNQQVSQLSSSATKEIAEQIHRERLLGTPDSELEKQMTRMLQAEKLHIANDLESCKQELSIEKEEKKRVQEENDKNRNALIGQLKKEARKEVCNILITKCLYAFVLVPIVAIAIWYIMKSTLPIAETTEGKIISIVIDAFVALVFDGVKLIPKIWTTFITRNKIIDKKVQEKLDKLDNSQKWIN